MFPPVDTAWGATLFDAWMLGAEATSVICLRMALLATGGAPAQREAVRMMTEKWDASAALGTLALSGGLGTDPRIAANRVIGHYKARVTANRKRLSRR